MSFVWGALCFASMTAGLFFLRFWRESRDRLFVFFAIAFWVFGGQWAGLAIVNPVSDSRHLLYVVRLAAYVLILAGIIDKNRREGR